MASAHGAGLMLVPVLIPLCLAGRAGAGADRRGLAADRAGRGRRAHAGDARDHRVVALAVYQWVGVAFLRKGWFNLDLIWTIALVVTGLVLLLA